MHHQQQKFKNILLFQNGCSSQKNKSAVAHAPLPQPTACPWSLSSLSNQQVEAAVLHLLPSLDKKSEEVEGLRIYLLLFELLYVLQRNKCQQMSKKLTMAVAAAMLSLSDTSLQVIGTVTNV